MFIRLLFWFLLFYISFKFILKVIIPAVMSTRSVRSKMKDMNENIDNSQTSGHSSSANAETFTTSGSKTPSAKGDYIDFEEIK